MDEAYVNINKLKEKWVYNGEVVLAYEYLACGSRYFIVILYKYFLSFFVQLQLNNRSWYEMIIRNLFCKLYFDTE